MNRVVAFALTLASALANADGLRDPTRPPLPQSARSVIVHEALPEVSAVFSSGKRRKAVVDGRLVQAGDALNNGTIESVSADGVIWRCHGVTHELLLQRAPANFKKPAMGQARIDNGAQ